MQKPLTQNGVSRLWNNMKEYINDTVTPIGMFSLEVDSSGNLYAIYPDGSTPPAFDYNSTTGDLYLIIPD